MIWFPRAKKSSTPRASSVPSCRPPKNHNFADDRLRYRTAWGASEEVPMDCLQAQLDPVRTGFTQDPVVDASAHLKTPFRTHLPRPQPLCNHTLSPTNTERSPAMLDRSPRSWRHLWDMPMWATTPKRKEAWSD
mmetsp:Transcript_31974/g.62915  ORF Transcript_31974/g.62915 Transcript_31974/m.62915 type:complete len:134 (+) Transcript_31974:50-451(+)